MAVTVTVASFTRNRWAPCPSHGRAWGTSLCSSCLRGLLLQVLVKKHVGYRTAVLKNTWQFLYIGFFGTPVCFTWCSSKRCYEKEPVVCSRLSEDPWPKTDQEPCARFCPGTRVLQARGSAPARDGLTVHSAVWAGVAGMRAVAAHARAPGRVCLWSRLQQTGSPEGTGPAARSQVTGGCFPLRASVFVNERPGLGHDGEALWSRPAAPAFPWAPCTGQAPSAETPFFSLWWKRASSMTGLAPWPSIHRVAGRVLPAVPGTGVLPEQVPSWVLTLCSCPGD